MIAMTDKEKNLARLLNLEHKNLKFVLISFTRRVREREVKFAYRKNKVNI